MSDVLSIAVQIPAKLAGLYQPRRYKVMHGGRGGGKSHGVAEVLLELGARRPLRILCAREIQKSMRDSVHRLLKDKIVKLGLEAFYEVLDTEIRGSNGTLILFTGLQSHTVDSIKSFEGVDIVWVEEAHGVSKKSWDVLSPTIRKEGSEIWMTLNPDMETDETYTRFISSASDDTWVCEINWRDNPWFPEVLNQERLKAKRSMLKDDYEHIWEGKPRRVAAGAIYRYEIEHLYADKRACRLPYDSRLPVHTVWDLGWNDAMTISMVQITPQDIRIIDYMEDSHRTYEWYVTQLEKRPYRWGIDYLPHDGKTKNPQTGKNAEMLLKELGRRRVVCLSALDVEEGIKAVRMMFSRCYFDSVKTARLLECLKRYQRAIHSTTGEAKGPLHDQYSHGADCFRYIAQSAEHMLRSQQQRPVVPQGAGNWAPLDREIGY
ncbi:PBSX family phage terminase large subunit [Comamonas testosteroni]|uniref:PBSX family phage terminase large subunit n=1 Tax=Comamonas testosteroni TaxID=285 RepID=UPI0023AB4E16|nr:PBSX family phage terminase large subunit [Comamonas testosteroni]WEE79452.1 PBSX family phage terminase large subunit [Comamonas testosteroni]